MKEIKLITFDLDDTLWDNVPTIKKAEIELDYASKFDNIIINNDLEESKKIALTLIKEFIDE